MTHLACARSLMIAELAPGRQLVSFDLSNPLKIILPAKIIWSTLRPATSWERFMWCVRELKARRNACAGKLAHKILCHPELYEDFDVDWAMRHAHLIKPEAIVETHDGQTA